MDAYIFDIRHFSVHDGPGIRSSIFFKGCPLRCTWCHNPESQQLAPETFVIEKKLDNRVFQRKEQIGKSYTISDVLEQIIPQQPFFEESNGGITLTGGDPLMQSSFAVELLKKAKEYDLHTALDTCGFASTETIKKVAPYTDLFLYDLKIMDAEQHKKHTGVSNEIIIENLKLLNDLKKETIVRIPLIKNITDTEDNLIAIRNLIGKLNTIIGIDLLPYHPIAKGKYKRMEQEYELEQMTSYSTEEAKKKAIFFQDLNLKISIGG